MGGKKKEKANKLNLKFDTIKRLISKLDLYKQFTFIIAVS